MTRLQFSSDQLYGVACQNENIRRIDDGAHPLVRPVLKFGITGRKPFVHDEYLRTTAVETAKASRSCIPVE